MAALSIDGTLDVEPDAPCTDQERTRRLTLLASTGDQNRTVANLIAVDGLTRSRIEAEAEEVGILLHLDPRTLCSALHQTAADNLVTGGLDHETAVKELGEALTRAELASSVDVRLIDAMVASAAEAEFMDDLADLAEATRLGHAAQAWDLQADAQFHAAIARDARARLASCPPVLSAWRLGHGTRPASRSHGRRSRRRARTRRAGSSRTSDGGGSSGGDPDPPHLRGFYVAHAAISGC